MTLLPCCPLVLISSEEQLADQAERSAALVPIRVEFETETHRIRDCFVWNLHESLVTPEQFARTFTADLDLPATWADTVAAQIRAQLEDQDGVGSMELAVDGGGGGGDEVPECRVILSVSLIFSPLQIHFISTNLYTPDRCAGGQPSLIGSYRVGLAFWAHTGRIHPPTLPRPRTSWRGRTSHCACNP